jgi:hypothetical protein
MKARGDRVAGRGAALLAAAAAAAALTLGAARPAQAQPAPLGLIDRPGAFETSIYAYDAAIDVTTSLKGHLEQIEEDLFDAFALSAALPFEIRSQAGTRGLAEYSLATATTQVYFSVTQPTLVLLSWDFTGAGDRDPEPNDSFGFVIDSVTTGLLFQTAGRPAVGTLTLLLQPDTYFLMQDHYVENLVVGEIKSNYASLSVVPEPRSAMLLALGIGALLLAARRKGGHGAGAEGVSQ